MCVSTLKCFDLHEGEAARIDRVVSIKTICTGPRGRHLNQRTRKHHALMDRGGYFLVNAREACMSSHVAPGFCMCTAGSDRVINLRS